MRLWQKIFVISLAFIVLTTEGVVLLVLTSNFNRTLERETEQGVREHSLISASIESNLLYQRLRRNELVLQKEEVTSIMKVTLTQQFPGSAIGIYQGGMPFASAELPQLSAVPTLAETIVTTGKLHSVICETGAGSFILVGSQATLEGEKYAIYTATDVTKLFRAHRGELQSAVFWAIALALCAAGILLFLVYRLLAPMRQTNRLLRQISGGDYSLRLPEKGSYEFRELAQNVNAMAAATAENFAALESVAESRKRFIDNFAHEMKTPLTSILGFSDILRIKKNVSEKERREYASIVVEETKRLRNLSGKLLELATSDTVNLEFEEVSIAELFREVHISVLPILSRRHMRLVCTPLPGKLRIDRALFKSLLYNLIDNACKASLEEAQIELSAALAEGRYSITVEDHGAGIGPDQLAHITEPFYVADKSRARRQGGVGLGLSLCLEIARQHGAKLKISSALGQGTLATILFLNEEVGRR